ncbi:HNH endonuclease [Vibrio splendidus]
MSNRPKIPAEIRREVLVEAGHRCAIQHCRNTSNLDLHHIVPWAECQEHKVDNLIALCPNCHRLAHDNSIDRKSLLKYKEVCIGLNIPPVHHEDDSLKTFIKFNPNSGLGILDSNNIIGVIDNGVLHYSFIFDEHFSDLSFIVKASGDSHVLFRVVNKTVSSIEIVFEHPCSDLVKLEFSY